MQLLSKEAQNVPESEKIRIVVSLLFYLRTISPPVVGNLPSVITSNYTHV